MSETHDRSVPSDHDAGAQAATDKRNETDPEFRASVNRGLDRLENHLLKSGIPAELLKRVMRRHSDSTSAASAPRLIAEASKLDLRNLSLIPKDIARVVAEYRQMAIELYQQFATKPTAQPMATPRENPDKVWIPVKQYFDKFCPVSDETAGLWTRAALSVLRQGDDSVRFQLQSGPSDWGLMVSIDGQRTIAMPGPNHTEIVKYGAADFNRIRIGLAPYAKDTQ